MLQNWVPLNSNARGKAWDFIYQRLQFKPYNEPTAQLPFPSETKSIEGFFDEDFQDSLYDDLHEKMEVVFQAITTDGERMLALNWQHDCYSFDPRLPFEKDEFDEGQFQFFQTEITSFF